ncbi:MAG: HNH endonuclease domain-containing protein, partial [Chloroflexota bacterium]
MARYDSNEARTRPLDEYVQSLSWLDAERNTAEIRRVVDRLTDKGKRVYCVWTGSALSQKYAIDHCFAFAYWPNNDLWNLLPVHPKANARKSDKIPSAMLLEKASEMILNWWS